MREALVSPKAAARVIAMHVLGGPGSGNFGHAGRPGSVGGSGEGVTTEDRAIGDELITKWRETGKEHGIAVGKDGQIIGRSDGTDDSVDFPASLSKQDPLLKARWHHNHPYETSLSTGDMIAFANTPALDKIYAHTENTTYVATKVSGKERELYFAAKDVFPAKHGEALDRYLAHGDIEKFRAESRASQHLAMQELHKRGLVVYSWTKRETRVLAAEEDSTPLHQAADAHVKDLAVAVRYAFAVARKQVAGSTEATIEDKVATVLERELMKVLPGALTRCAVEGARVAATGLRALGGPGSGNFGHEGRPGEVGGSGPGDGNATIGFHGSAKVNLESILEHGIRPSKAGNSKVDEAFISTDEQDARTYARGIGKDGIIFEVHVPASEIGRFKNPLGGPIYHTSETIPATWIKGIYQRDGTFDERGLDRWVKIRSLESSDKTVMYIAIDLATYDDLRDLGDFRVLKPPSKPSVKFNAINTRAAKWAKKHAAEMVTDITETSRKRIKAAIASLLEGESYSSVLDKIAKAVGDDDRAELIARHETMSAVSAGQREAWAQAVEDDLLTGREKRVWIATPIGACPVCEKLDGKTATLTGNFPGGIAGCPAHVACRCTEGLQ